MKNNTALTAKIDSYLRGNSDKERRRSKGRRMCVITET